MPDLIEKYFCEDLTEGEWRSLDGLLAASTENSDRFLGYAQAAFERYGLPDPVPSAKGWLRPGTGWMGPVVLGVALSAWWALNRMPPTHPAVVPDVPMPAIHEAAPAPMKPARAKPAMSIPRAAPPVSAVNIPSAGTAPPPVGETAEESYKVLKVVVEQDVPGTVVIRVVSPDGSEARRLFDGELAAGEWAIRWDGKRTDGKPAQPGVYTIEIDDGKSIKSRQVQIQ